MRIKMRDGTQHVWGNGHKLEFTESPQIEPEPEAQRNQEIGTYDGGTYARLAKDDRRVKYKPADKDYCRDCQMNFGSRCRIIEGTIDRDFTCKLFKVRTAVYTEPIEGNEEIQDD